jgi:hypothetical protein
MSSNSNKIDFDGIDFENAIFKSLESFTKRNTKVLNEYMDKVRKRTDDPKEIAEELAYAKDFINELYIPRLNDD